MVSFKIKIEKPYILDGDDLRRLILKPFIYGNDWDKEENKYHYTKIKNKIRDHLSFYQDNYCAYCRFPITYGGKGEHLDHILSKSDYPHLMFSPYNLALSCKDCNVSKNSKNVLSNFKVSTILVPHFNFNYKIVNPYFDDYFKHIILEDGMFYRALDFNKGYNTIEMFELWSPLYNHKWATFHAIDKKTKEEKVAFRISDITIDEKEKKHLTNYYNKLINSKTF